METTQYTATYRIISSTYPLGEWPNLLTLRGRGETFEALIGHSGDFDKEDIPQGALWGCCYPNDLTGPNPGLAGRFILGEKAGRTASSLHIEWNDRVIRFSLKDWGILPIWFGQLADERRFEYSPPPKPETRYREFLRLYRAVRRGYPTLSVLQALRATEYRLHVRWGHGCEEEMGTIFYWVWKDKGRSLGSWEQFGGLLNKQLREDMEGCETSYFVLPVIYWSDSTDQ
jgi:hypothetical protein